MFCCTHIFKVVFSYYKFLRGLTQSVINLLRKMGKEQINQTIEEAKKVPRPLIARKLGPVSDWVPLPLTPLSYMFSSAFHSIRPRWPDAAVEDNRSRLEAKS